MYMCMDKKRRTNTISDRKSLIIVSQSAWMHEYPAQSSLTTLQFKEVTGARIIVEREINSRSGKSYIDSPC